MSKTTFLGLAPLTIGRDAMSMPIFLASLVPMIVALVLAYTIVVQEVAASFSHWVMLASVFPPCVWLFARRNTKARKKIKERLDALWRVGWTSLGFVVVFHILGSGDEIGLEELFGLLSPPMQGLAFGVLGAIFCGLVALSVAEEFYPAKADD